MQFLIVATTYNPHSCQPNTAIRNIMLINGRQMYQEVSANLNEILPAISQVKVLDGHPEDA